MRHVVLFDLDGTISDSAPGILGSLELAFADHDLPWIDADAARLILGPPFRSSLVPHMPPDLIEPVIATYRRYYNDHGGMFNTTMYEGVGEVVAELHAAGFVLGLATSKPEEPARAILDFLGVDKYFEVITGDTHDGVYGTKALVVGEALRRLGNPHAAAAVMIGDRHHDVDGAGENGLPCIGVEWGYGGFEELDAAGARQIVAKPAELSAAVHRHFELHH